MVDFECEQWRANDGVVSVHATLKPWVAHWEKDTAFESIEDVVKARRSSSSVSTTASEASDSLSDWNSPSPSSAIAAPSYSVDNSYGDQASCFGSDESIEDELSSLETFSEVNADYEEFDSTDITAIKWRRGKWHVRRVKTHHMAGTFFDTDAPELLRSLFSVMAQNFEQD